jgi:hypothetical protein
MGRPCVKAIQPSKSKKGQMNSIETCTITESPPTGLSFEGLVRWQSDRLHD